MTKILVIDDEASLREAITDLLSFEGYETYAAPDGAVGIQYAFEILPDLIVSDLNMPDIDGYQVLQTLRENPKTASIPFIFITAHADRSFVRHGMELGADDYITKPFTNTELLAAIKTRLQRQEAVISAAMKELTPIKRRLSRVVTHELKTPLASIKMAQDLISRQLGQIPTEQLGDLMETLRQGSNRLSHLVEQIVLMTQLESDLLSEAEIARSGTPMQVWTILNVAINRARQYAYKNQDGHILANQQDIHATVLCHPQALTHALAELIANALIFSPAGASVELAEWEQDDTVWISILDHGPGIPPDRIADALRDFEQIDRETSEQQGLGLGIPLARRIIEVHGGRFDLRSKVGHGTQIEIGLPLAEQDN